MNRYDKLSALGEIREYLREVLKAQGVPEIPQAICDDFNLLAKSLGVTYDNWCLPKADGKNCLTAKLYQGHRDPKERNALGDCWVTVTQPFAPGAQPLDPGPSQKVRNHSPDGFSWGYGGSGPAQLALAILLDYFGREELPWIQKVYQSFKFQVVAKWEQGEDWSLTGPELEAWAQKNGLGPLGSLPPAVEHTHNFDEQRS